MKQSDKDTLIDLILCIVESGEASGIKITLFLITDFINRNKDLIQKLYERSLRFYTRDGHVLSDELNTLYSLMVSDKILIPVADGSVISGLKTNKDFQRHTKELAGEFMRL